MFTEWGYSSKHLNKPIWAWLKPAVSNISKLSSFSSTPVRFSVQFIMVMLRLIKVERDRPSIKI